MAGRGYGKTRIGAEWVRKRASSGQFRYVNIAGATADDARDIMIEGESGILNVCPPWQRPDYLPSKRRLEWPNGCWSLIFTADEPERFRGKQHESLWADELAAWRYPEAWNQAMLGLRIGPDPKCVITTTPRPTDLIRWLIDNPRCVTTHGTTYENRANLAPEFYDTIIGQYEGKRLGRQELLAELIDDVEGALWTRQMIEDARVEQREVPELSRIVVAIDPSGSSKESANAAGIIVAGYSRVTGFAYVLSDRTIHGSPLLWASTAIQAYHAFKADRIVAEKNYGAEMVETTLRSVDPRASLRTVDATDGKRKRAEPVSGLYEQRLVKHVGAFPELEDELCGWTPDSAASPNRLDALVWAITDLMLATQGMGKISYRPALDPDTYQVGEYILTGDSYIDRT